jgi:putative transcriptional regulator
MDEIFINYVKQFRIAKEITQAELAGELRISRQSIISIENGKYIPSLPLALRMAKYFNCAMEDLFKIVEG